jgi:hypothetical protein
VDKAMSFDVVFGDKAAMKLVAECPKYMEQITDWVQKRSCGHEGHRKAGLLYL